VKRLAIVTTHPIQYHSHWFRALAYHPEINLQVLYCHNATPKEQAEAGFGVEFEWDVSLLDGYPNRFLNNVAPKPSLSTFAGLDTPEIKSIIEKENFHAVLINGWHYKSAWQAMRACWSTGSQLMVRSDSHLHTDRHSLKRLAKWPFYHWFIPRLDACLAVGKWSYDYFLHYGARADRTFIVPHVVNTDYFGSEWKRLMPQRSQLRGRWGINSDEDFVCLYAGKLTPQKRPLDFVRAIDLAAKQGCPVSGVMVGDGPLRGECEAYVKSKKAPLHFTGFLNQSEISKAYVCADVLVLPSDGRETWGLVVNEAMACGIPCIVSDRVGCGPDMITSDETGWSFPLGDTVALAKLISDIAKDHRPARLKAGVRARSAKYSAAMAVDRLLDALGCLSAH
jgi:glycosyltransferase involved in cell wall biosynthesis